MTVTTKEMITFLKAVYYKENRFNVLSHEIGFSKEKLAVVFEEAMKLDYIQGGRIEKSGRDNKYIYVFTNNAKLKSRGIEFLNYHSLENDKIYEIK